MSTFYTEDHLWIKEDVEHPLCLQIGKTIYNPIRNNKIIILQTSEKELPLNPNDTICVIESDKFTQEIKMLFNCRLHSINDGYTGAETDWICKVNVSDVNWYTNCMNKDDYNRFVSE